MYEGVEKDRSSLVNNCRTLVDDLAYIATTLRHSDSRTGQRLA